MAKYPSAKISPLPNWPRVRVIAWNSFVRTVDIIGMALYYARSRETMSEILYLARYFLVNAYYHYESCCIWRVLHWRSDSHAILILLLFDKVPEILWIVFSIHWMVLKLYEAKGKSFVLLVSCLMKIINEYLVTCRLLEYAEPSYGIRDRIHMLHGYRLKQRMIRQCLSERHQSAFVL